MPTLLPLALHEPSSASELFPEVPISCFRVGRRVLVHGSLAGGPRAPSSVRSWLLPSLQALLLPASPVGPWPASWGTGQKWPRSQVWLPSGPPRAFCGSGAGPVSLCSFSSPLSGGAELARVPPICSVSCSVHHSRVTLLCPALCQALGTGADHPDPSLPALLLRRVWSEEAVCCETQKNVQETDCHALRAIPSSPLHLLFRVDSPLECSSSLPESASVFSGAGPMGTLCLADLRRKVGVSTDHTVSTNISGLVSCSHQFGWGNLPTSQCVDTDAGGPLSRGAGSRLCSHPRGSRPLTPALTASDALPFQGT